MANKWIQHVQAYAKKHGMKYNEAMKSAECKSAYNKKGAGIMDDGLNYVKNEGKKLVKSKAKNLIDAGADLIKEKYLGGNLIRNGKMPGKMTGNGLFGNVLKTVGNAALDIAPIPGLARDIGKMGTDYLIDRSGFGLMKRKKYNNGGALYMA